MIRAAITGVLLLWAVAAHAGGMLINPYAHAPGAPACSSTAVTYLDTKTETADNTTFTFTAVPIGDPACAGNIRLVYVIAACHSVTATSAQAVTVAGVAATQMAITVVALRTGYHIAQVDTGTTADIVITQSGAADNTCERLSAIIYSVITTDAARVDAASDSSPAGFFDLDNVAVTAGGASIVTIVAEPANACGDLDATFNGTETVIVDVSATLESAITYASGHFTADSTATTDDYVNISCGAVTTGTAIVFTWPPPV